MKLFYFLLIFINISDANFSSLHQLSKNVFPYSYNLTLLMLVSNYFKYNGHVSIDFHVFNVTNLITVNIDSLIIHKNETSLIKIDDVISNKNIPILSQNENKEKQFYNIYFKNMLKSGNYTLQLQFTGNILLDDVFGFYRSTYKVNNETKWIGATQFSTTFARKAFPCFDEPYFKSTFQLHIGHQSHQSVISNTEPLKVVKINESYLITSMKETPKMSTYLLGWIIHEDFSYVKLANVSKFGMWTRKSMEGSGLKVLEKGLSIYKKLESWLGTENPIGIDHVAVPEFYFNAMENWGMITFREAVGLFEENNTPTVAIHKGLNTMAHEYAHTWFGNLISPEFWNCAWMKEGFATYFSYFGRSLADESSRYMDFFVVETLQDVLLKDSKNHSRTLNGKPSQVNQALDYMDFVPYSKGASVVRMIAQLLGKQKFQSALQSYLKFRSYTSVTPSIFYGYLPKFSYELEGEMIDLGDVIESYSNQPGYPVLTIVRNYTTNFIEISQERFYDFDVSSSKDSTYSWWIPLNLVSKSQGKSNVSTFGSIWLRPDNKKVITKLEIDPLDWVICDIDKIGYYRVNYDTRNWNSLATNLNSIGIEAINHVSRAAIIDDAFHLAKAGYIHYRIPFHLSKYLINETKYEPWISAIKSFKYLHFVFQDLPSIQNALEVHVRHLLEKIYQKLLIESSNELRRKLFRQNVLSTACQMKNDDCLRKSIQQFNKWISNSSHIIDPDLKSFILCIGVQLRASEVWETAFQKFIHADFHIEKELLISGLGCSTNSMVIEKFIDFSIKHNDAELPQQYRLTVIEKILDGHKKNINFVLNYLSENFEKVLQFRGKRFLVKVFDLIKVKITCKESFEKLKSLVAKNKNVLGKIGLDAISHVDETLKWIQNYAPVIEEILNPNE